MLISLLLSTCLSLDLSVFISAMRVTLLFHWGVVDFPQGVFSSSVSRSVHSGAELRS